MPSADTSLRSNTSDSNFGASPALLVGVGNFGSPTNRGLLKFSLADIPANATITSATLKLIVTQNNRPPASFGIHRVLVDWGEGLGLGGPANSGEATWNARLHPSPAWTSPGGSLGSDYVATASATATIDGTGSTNDFSSASLVADLQLWLQNPGTNFGWMIIAAGEPAGSGKQLGSRESLGSEPILEVHYTIPADPIPPVLSNVALQNNALRFSFTAEANRAYTVEYSGRLPAASWTVLTNFPAAPAPTNFVVTDPLTPSNRFYRARTP